MKKWMCFFVAFVGCSSPEQTVVNEVPDSSPSDYLLSLDVPVNTVAGTVSIFAQPIPEAQTLRVNFFIDEVPFAVDISAPFVVELQSTTLEDGPHEISAVAERIDHATAKAQATLVVDNRAPQIDWSMPTQDATVLVTDPLLVKLVSLEIPVTVAHGELQIDDEPPVSLDVASLTATIPSPRDTDYPAKHVLRYSVFDGVNNEAHDNITFNLTRERLNVGFGYYDTALGLSSHRTEIVHDVSIRIMTAEGKAEQLVVAPPNTYFTGVRLQQGDRVVVGLRNAVQMSGPANDALQEILPSGEFGWRLPANFAGGGYLSTSYDPDAKVIIASRIHSLQFEQTGEIVQVTPDGQESVIASLDPWHVASTLSLSAPNQTPPLMGLETVDTKTGARRFVMYDRTGAKLWSSDFPSGNGNSSRTMVMNAATAASVFTNIQNESFEVIGFGAAGPVWQVFFAAQWPVAIFSVEPGELIVASDGGRVVRVRADGTIAWERQLSSVVRAVPYGKDLWIAQYAKTERLSLETGQTIMAWKAPTMLGEPSLDLAVVHAVPTGSSGFYAVHALTPDPMNEKRARIFRVNDAGQILWRQTAAGVHGPQALKPSDDGDLFVFWNHNDGTYSVSRYAESPTF